MLYHLSRFVLRPLARAIWRPTVTGKEHIPAEGPVIIASNHLSFIDSITIILVAPRQVAFLAKAEYFTGSGVRGALSRWWFESIGMIPVERDDHRAAQASLDIAYDALQDGKAFGIYPEGTRSRDGRLYRGKTGVAWLALKAGCPIVPAALAGTQDIQPVGTRIPRVRKVSVQFGEPIQVGGRFDGMPMGRARRVLTDEVMDAVHALSGQELAGVYNERPKHPPGATEA
ncbi:MAG TPA: lysophospholipid acyltransferase family protein [Segeticoccus sp.]|uniref:lysophospholipid acyltransferase family protein n=1 Tax=Segeticoccus sp. TaxID=2706531 RepID=UPI002D7F362E|nr:lysophospholipid acyltransferase family protein [Segeticoccus sp.]HET8598776.1 lysophospholipid acyltransferase family protein [Segeticoccus sp.]